MGGRGHQLGPGANIQGGFNEFANMSRRAPHGAADVARCETDSVTSSAITPFGEHSLYIPPNSADVAENSLDNSNTEDLVFRRSYRALPVSNGAVARQRRARVGRRRRRLRAGASRVPVFPK